MLRPFPRCSATSIHEWAEGSIDAEQTRAASGSPPRHSTTWRKDKGALRRAPLSLGAAG